MKLLITTLSLIFIQFSFSLAQVIKVPEDMGIIQDALNAASPGDSVIVSSGTYYENIIWPPTEGIILISESGPTNTIIDGSDSAIVIEIYRGVDTTTIISGFTIQNGYTGWLGAGIHCSDNSSPKIYNNYIMQNTSDYGGGGIGCHNSSPIIINNAIVDNNAQQGAGIQIDNCSSIVIKNNFIIANTANEGGGGISINGSEMIAIVNNSVFDNTSPLGGGISTYESDITFVNDTINYNIANDAGGGIFADLSDLEIDNCIFEDNETVNGGGGGIFYQVDTLYNATPFQLEIKNSQFSSNTASSSGGGIRILNWYDTLATDVVIDNCDFIENSADNSSGLGIVRSNLSLSNSIFKGNTAVRYSGGIAFNGGSIGKVWNCLFASNEAATGGGNFNSGGGSVWGGSNVDFMNCTFADNSASYGAGLSVGGGSFVTTTNCIFWGNDLDQIALVSNNNSSTITVNYCDVQGGENSVNVDSLSTLNWDISNKDEDPLFENSGNGDYHLQNTSPCIQTAIDSIEIAGVMHHCPPDDIEGYPRPYPVGTNPDMGAYEYQLLVGIEENSAVHPTEYALYQNYPNPFNPTTTIKYQIPELSFVTLKVYDVLGNEIATLVKEEKQSGTYEITWYAEQLPSGVYFYRLQAGDFVETKKIMVMK